MRARVTFAGLSLASLVMFGCEGPAAEPQRGDPVLAGKTVALIADRPVGPAHTLGTPHYVIPEWSRTNSIAFNGRDWVALWGADREPHLSRVSLAGEVRDPVGVWDHAWSGNDITLGADGETVLLVRTGAAPGCAQPCNGRSLLVDRLDENLASVGATDAISLDDFPTHIGKQPRVLRAGDEFVIAWRDYEVSDPEAWGTYYARLSREGRFLDTRPVRVQAADAPTLFTDGKELLASRLNSASLTVFRVGAAGALTEAASLALGEKATNVRNAYAHGVHTVVWSDGSARDADVLALRFAPDFSALDPEPLRLGSGSFPSVEPAFNGVIVMWSAAGATQARVLAADGQVGPVFKPRDPGGVSGSRVAGGDADHALVLWPEGGTRIDRDGHPLDAGAPLRVAQELAEAEFVQLAGADGSYLTAWSERWPGQLEVTPNDPSLVSTLWLARVAADGSPIGEAHEFYRGPYGPLKATISMDGLAGNAQGFLALFHDHHLHAARVSHEGRVLGELLDLGENRSGVGVAAHPGGFLVSWLEGRKLYGRLIANDGAVGDAFALPAYVSSELMYGHGAIGLVSDDQQFYVVWEDDRSSTAGVWAARISFDGKVLDPTGLRVHDKRVMQVAAGAGPHGVLITWIRATGVPVLLSKVLAPDGHGLEEEPQWLTRSYAAYTEGKMSVLADAAGFTVAFAYMPTPIVRSEGVAAVRVGPSGEALSGLFLVDSGRADGAPKLASAAPGQMLAAFGIGDVTLPALAFRPTVRSIALLSAGTSCQSDAACATGHCVDGVCCNTECGGGAATDCQACSRSTGAAKDGECGPVARGEVCRPAQDSQCDPKEVCNGLSLECPQDKQQRDGWYCFDRDACTQRDVCQSGKCVGQDLISCPAPSACQAAGACDANTGECHYESVADGTACEDGNPCTVGDACAAGACAAGAPKTCEPPGECQQAAACSTDSGDCVYTAQPDGAPCAGVSPRRATSRPVPVAWCSSEP